jgi:hypothetical protein
MMTILSIYLYDDLTGFEYDVEVEVTHWLNVKGDSSTWDSDWDYYGYTELDFDIVSVLRYDGINDKQSKVSDIPECLDDELKDKIEQVMIATDEEDDY